MQFSIQHLDFTYDGSYTPVFQDLSFNIDTDWKLGLIARNGRGKSTLLHILSGSIPGVSLPRLPLHPVCFPFPIGDKEQLALFAAQEMAPEAEEWQLIREMHLLGLDEDVLYRPLKTLSRGEQTKLQLAALFATESGWPLIDEPTNHLDVHGRELTAAYLNRKSGFILVSHDRAFLNACTDHILAINRSDTWVMQGNYDTFRDRLDQQNAFEAAQDAVLKKDIGRLEESARKMGAWSSSAERDKYHVPESKQAVTDRGFMGAKAAAMMKRSKNTLRRREEAIEEKKGLLHNMEYVGNLKINPLSHPKSVLIRVEEGKVSYGGEPVCEGIGFELKTGQRLALTGANGCGKSSILKGICGQGEALTGRISIAPNLIISFVPQSTEGVVGTMKQFIEEAQIDETLFKAILRNMDFGRELFEQPLERMSMGQRKKLMIARSLCTSAHLYVWDEPLNYLDVYSREQIEKLIVSFQPTMLLVEHDRMFLDRVCTGMISIN